ncbi:MAG: hypothetical protein AMJ53_02735 [Gammaproteobacteria bacterium SG8_11]|nr:MAG: hypothetical protein AMJ53_02735 [Gammaproteobacteria bacterium SG8_11]
MINILKKYCILTICAPFMMLTNPAFGSSTYLSFLEADITALALSVSHITGDVYLIENSIPSKITMETSRYVNECELKSVFEIVLNYYGYQIESSDLKYVVTPYSNTTKSTGNIYRISPSSKPFEKTHSINADTETNLEVYVRRNGTKHVLSVNSANDDSCITEIGNNNENLFLDEKGYSPPIKTKYKIEKMLDAAELAGFLTAHAILVISEGKTLIPIYGYLNAKDEMIMETLYDDLLKNGTETGKVKLDKNPDKSSVGVLIYDVRLTYDSGNIDALVIEFRDFGPNSGLAKLLLPYTPATSKSKFVVHQPSVIRMTKHMEEEKERILQNYYKGIDKHSVGAKVWRRHSAESN